MRERGGRAMSGKTDTAGLNTRAGKAQQKGLSKNAKRQFRRYGKPLPESFKEVLPSLWDRDEDTLVGTKPQYAVASQLGSRNMEMERQRHIRGSRGSAGMEKIFEGNIPKELSL